VVGEGGGEGHSRERALEWSIPEPSNTSLQVQSKSSSARMTLFIRVVDVSMLKA
jgi:hypothetical protein